MFKTLLLYIYALLYSILVLPILIYARIFNKPNIIYHLLGFFAKTALVLLRINYVFTYDFDVANYPKNALYISNHQSMFDSFFTFLTIPNPKSYYIAGEYSFFLKIPLASYVFTAMNSVFVDRKSIRDAVKSYSAGLKVLQNDNNLVIFPEGEVTAFIDGADDLVGPFHSGSFKPAMKLHKDIIPITISGSDKIFSELSMFSKINSGTIHIHFHNPVTPEIYHDMDTAKLADYCHDIISSKLRE